MKRYRILSLMLVMICSIMLTISGCGKAADKSTDKTQTSETQGATTTDSSTTTPITLNYIMMQTATEVSPEVSTDSDIGKIIEKDTGCTIKYEYLVGDPKTKAGVMTASGDYPDIITGANLTTPIFVNAKALIPLEDLIEEYAPNLRKLYDVAWNRLKEKDGHIYYLPANVPINLNIKNGWDPWWGFQLQKAAVVELGYPKIVTIEDYFNALKVYKDKHPMIDGKKSIGMVVKPSNWNGALEALIGQTGETICFVDPKTYKVSLQQTSEEYHKLMQIGNKAYNDGLIDPESFVMNDDQYNAKLASGSVIGTIAAGWEMSNANGNFIKQNKEELGWFPYPCTMDSNYKELWIGAAWIPSGEGVGISVSSKNAIRIIQLWDYIAKEEILKMVNWGIKDVDYSVNDTGKFVMSPEQYKNWQDPAYKKKRGISIFTFGWPSVYGSFSDGNAADPGTQSEVNALNASDLTKKILTAYNIKAPQDLFDTNAPVTKYSYLWTMTKPAGDAGVIAESKMSDIQLKYVSKLFMAKPDQFENIWNEFQTKLKAIDLQKTIDLYQKEVDYRVTNW